MALTYGPTLGLLVNGAEGEGHYADLMRQWRGLDGLVMPAVIDKDLNTPPGSPSDGARYIVGPSPTGAWSGHAGKITRWSSVANAWEFFTPQNGWRALVLDEGVEYRRLGGAWTAQLKVGNGTAATNTTTGDFVVVGGMAVGGSLHCNNLVSYGMQTTLGDGTTPSTFRLTLNGAVSQNKRIEWATAGVTKWRMYTNGTESGVGDAGMNWNLEALTDAGVGIDTPITITRAAGGNMTVRRPLALTSTIGFNNASPIAKPTVTGSRGGNAALASLMTALANYGLVTDSTTA